MSLQSSSNNDLGDGYCRIIEVRRNFSAVRRRAIERDHREYYSVKSSYSARTLSVLCFDLGSFITIPSTIYAPFKPSIGKSLPFLVVYCGHAFLLANLMHEVTEHNVDGGMIFLYIAS